jgi:hypothetical protein
MKKGFRVVIEKNADGDYVATLYERVLWFLWFPINVDTAFSDSESHFFRQNLRKTVTKWIKAHNDDIEVINKTDLEL